MCDAFGRTPLNKNLSFVYCITFLRFVKRIFLRIKCRIFGCEKKFFFATAYANLLRVLRSETRWQGEVSSEASPYVFSALDIVRADRI